jgi:hypothetical protein
VVGRFQGHYQPSIAKGHKNAPSKNVGSPHKMPPANESGLGSIFGFCGEIHRRSGEGDFPQFDGEIAGAYLIGHGLFVGGMGWFGLRGEELACGGEVLPAGQGVGEGEADAGQAGEQDDEADGGGESE